MAGSSPVESQAKYRVGVFGASGYAGQDLVEILARHPNVDLVFATGSTFAGEPVPGTSLRYIRSEEASLEDVDTIFLALPHGVSAPLAAKGLAAGKRVIDLSADLRLDSPAIYQQWYKHEHPHPELLPTPYGLPEINRDQIRGRQVIAAPGCYPTTTLLGLYPLLKAKVLAPGRPIIVDAKSGVSGAGREPKSNTHFVEVFGNLSPYNVGRVHRHVPEIEQEMHKLDDRVGPLIFSPHLLPVDRGLMASIYVELDPAFDPNAVRGLFEQVYDSEPLVDLLPAGQQATLKHVVRTNKGAVSVTPPLGAIVHITSVTDNLRKGASSQAVQCFNLMVGLDETTGLL